jgi:hypothetical protein
MLTARLRTYRVKKAEKVGTNMKDNEKCGQCRFFVPKMAEDNKGECRRHAPRPGASFQIGGQDIGKEPRWPEVSSDCCCGEFEQK